MIFVWIRLLKNIKTIKIKKQIKIPKTASIDRLSGRFLRDGAEILSRPISEICNLSISRGVFPDACKVAKLKPIYKKGKKRQSLPTTELFLYFQLLLRWLNVHDETNKFLSENNILCNIQSKFKTNHSTSLCLPHLTDEKLKGFVEGLLTGMILTDLQEAFVNHGVLLEKN